MLYQDVTKLLRKNNSTARVMSDHEGFNTVFTHEMHCYETA